MKIVFIGGFNVNPERMLPIIKEHECYGIWESVGLWGVSVPAGGPYKQIQTITIDDIETIKPDIIWNLLSPWDGLKTSLKVLNRYPKIPFVRHSQGAATPWWTTTIRGGSKGNYNFKLFKEVLERSSGFMCPSKYYRDCLIDQGINIKNIPHYYINGMAYNKDLIGSETTKLYDTDLETHVALIGRQQHNKDIFLNNNIHLHYHSVNKIKNNSLYAHSEKYYGDIKFLREKVVNINFILKWKKEKWYTGFSKYDAGLMHFVGFRGIDVYKGIDINVPGRVNTYMLSGLPPIIVNTKSAILDFLQRKGNNYYIAFKNDNDLIEKLKDRSYLSGLQENVLKIRHKFSMQEEMKDIFKFFEGVI